MKSPDLHRFSSEKIYTVVLPAVIASLFLLNYLGNWAIATPEEAYKPANHSTIVMCIDHNSDNRCTDQSDQELAGADILVSRHDDPARIFYTDQNGILKIPLDSDFSIQEPSNSPYELSMSAFNFDQLNERITIAYKAIATKPPQQR